MEKEEEEGINKERKEEENFNRYIDDVMGVYFGRYIPFGIFLLIRIAFSVFSYLSPRRVWIGSSCT